MKLEEGSFSRNMLFLACWTAVIGVLASILVSVYIERQAIGCGRINEATGGIERVG